jgi:hypothetical protein
MRKVPMVGYVARFYCAACRTTFGLLPDFYASRTPGTLDEMERTAAGVEQACTMAEAGEAVRPGHAADAVTLPSAMAWTRRRARWVIALLATMVGLFPERFEGCAPSVEGFRRRLGTERALVKLRGIAQAYLYALPRPFGLLARWPARERATHGAPQSMGNDRPP